MKDPVVQQLRALLTEEGRFPTRRTWERRLAALPSTLPGLSGRLGRPRVTVLTPISANLSPCKVEERQIWRKDAQEQ